MVLRSWNLKFFYMMAVFACLEVDNNTDIIYTVTGLVIKDYYPFIGDKSCRGLKAFLIQTRNTSTACAGDIIKAASVTMTLMEKSPPELKPLPPL